MSALTHGNERVVPSRRLKLCGTEEIDPPSQQLAAGPLTAELENGQLRYIALNGVEVLRGIAFLVRDQNWGTYCAADRLPVGHRRSRTIHGRVQSAVRGR